MAIARPRLLLAAVLLLAACTTGDEPGRGSTNRDSTTSASSTSASSTDGSEADEPVPDDAVWIPDDDSLTFVRVDEREVPLTPGQVLAGVAYRRADGVTARIVHARDFLGPGGDVAGMETRVVPTEGGATAIVPLVGTAAATLTIAGAPDTEAATEAATELAALVGDGTQLGFESRAEPVERLGDFRLIGHFDPASPVVETTSTHIQYRTPRGGAVYVEQAELVDPDLPLEVAMLPSSAPIEDDDGLRVAVMEGATGSAPTLTTIVGRSRVTIAAAEHQLRPLAHALVPVARAVIDEMVREVNADAVARGESQPVVDGVTWYGNGNDPPVACIDGEEPDGCVEFGGSNPLTVAWIPRDGTYLVVGCIIDLFPVPEVVVNDRPIPTQTAFCGRAFSVADVAPGTLAVEFDDGPGGVGTYTYAVP
ncbi:MAG TPA: hypothetical protein VF228_11440 [Iamia sp.]